MNEIHLSLFAARKDAVGYSILSSLYHASEEGSLTRIYLSREDVLFALRVFAKKPKCFRDVERGLDAILLLNQEIDFEFMKKLWLMGSRGVQAQFTKYLELKLHQLYYSPSCYGDGDGVLAFDFCSPRLAKVEDYFCECIQYHLWRGDSSYLSLFPYQVTKELFRSERCMKYILRLFELYYGGEITEDGMLFEIFEIKPDRANDILQAITTKEQLDIFLNKTDCKYSVCDTLLEEKAALLGVIIPESDEEEGGWYPNYERERSEEE